MILSSDWMELQQIRWKVLVTDEAQRLKNQLSKLLTNMRQFRSDHRVLLTGTPLQNNTQGIPLSFTLFCLQDLCRIVDFTQFHW
jgi:hypothetical protein